MIIFVFGRVFPTRLNAQKMDKAMGAQPASHLAQMVIERAKDYAYSTPCSDAVTYQPTDGAQACLSSVSGREPEGSGWYGRRH